MGWLWDASLFLTRNQCGAGWTPGLTRVYQLAHFMIAVSCFLIVASALRTYARRRADWPAAPLLLLFGLFLACCGVTHLGDVLVFYWAPYRLFTLLAILTSFTAAAAAALLPIVVHSAARLPTDESVHQRNRALQHLLQQHDQDRQELALQNARLKAKVKKLELLLQTNAWLHEKSEAVEELTRILAEPETRPCTS